MTWTRQDQLLLRDGLRHVLDNVCSPAVVRQAWTPAGPGLERLWSALGEVGLFGLLVPMEAGGLGGSEVELALLMEECGRHAVPGPVVEHVVLGAPYLVATSHAQSEPAMEGALVVAVQEPGRVGVRWGLEADLVLLPGPAAWSVLPAADLRGADSQRLVDQSVSLVHAEASPSIPASEPGLAAERAALSVAAQLVGVATRMLEMTVEYAKVREQFGRPIGAQQAVKHHLASSWVAIEHARPVVLDAARALAAGESTAPRDVSCARVMAQQAVDLTGRAALQVHGAIGYTWEHDLHLWLKRSWVLSSMWGTTAGHRDRLETLVTGRDCLDSHRSTVR